MKILGLRVREVGSFREPVALDGLTGGLDVLAGPNEFGKSTLFRALEAAFTVPHTSKAASARDWMVPASGGAPTIEVDFEAAGAGYRLRKRYFTSARATLQKLDGSLLLRGADAEAQLTEVLSAVGGPERLGLLWVGQRKSLEPLKLADGARDGLRSLIADEVANAVGGGDMDAIRRKVAERLAGLVTLKQRKPVGPHKEASDLAARLTRDATEQREAVARGRYRLDRLGDLRDQHAALSAGAKRRERIDRTAAARTALEAARAAADNRRTAEALWQRLDSEQTMTARALGDFDRQAEEVSALAARRETFAADQSAHTVAAATLALSLAEAERAADEALSDESSARETLEAARREFSAQAARAESTALGKRLGDVETLTAQLAEAETRVAERPLLAPLRQKAETLGRTIEALTARLTARSVRVQIAYDKGGHGKIVRDGAPVTKDAEFAIDQQAELSVAGVGRITIAPAAAENVEAVAAQLGAAERTLAELLASASADSKAQLLVLADAQALAIADRDRLSARLDGLCPEGLPALRERAAAVGWVSAAPAPAAPAASPDPRVTQRRTGSVGLRAELAAAQNGSAVAALTQPAALELAAAPHPGPLPVKMGRGGAGLSLSDSHEPSHPAPPEERAPSPRAYGEWAGVRGGDAHGPSHDLAALEAHLRSTEQTRALASASLAKRLAEQQTLDIAFAKLTAETAMLAERHAALLALHQNNDLTTEHRTPLLAATQFAAERAREAVLVLAAAREKEPNPQGLLALEADLAAAITAEAQAAADLNRLDKDMAGLESLLERDALDGIVERLAETEEALAIAARSLARISAEIAALDLLDTHLAGAERDARAKYLAPVTERLAPYLHLVLPGAELDLGEAFDATGLTRDGRNEAIARLSDGTREQIAVLARLGLGRLLADTGYPMPLILDDALVYSDDDRIAASFAALEKAAAHHQVIVLTCRAKAFEQLGGARLVLRPWRYVEE